MRRIVLLTSLLISICLTLRSSDTKNLNSFVDKYDIFHTPLPDYVIGVEKNKISLNGDWWFNPQPNQQFEKCSDVNNINGWHRIKVPSEWFMEGFNVEKDSYAGYFRKFKVPHEWKNQRIIIRFESVNSECVLYLNGNKIGAHEGSMLPFEFEISDYIQKGENNLALYVKSESLADSIGKISHYAKHQVGGITRQVYIFAVPDVHIKDLNLSYQIDSDLQGVYLNFTAQLNSIAKDCRIDIELVRKGVYLYDSDESFENSVVLKRELSIIGNQIDENIGHLDDLELWHPENPFLYTLRCKLYVEDNLLEVITQDVGFKKIEIRGNVVYLNNFPIKLRGVALHDINPYEGRAIVDSLQILEDVIMFRKANCNYIRTAHYPKDSYFYDLCDRYGILVEDEAPMCWVQPEEVIDSVNSEFVVKNVISLIKRDRMHPSIFCWSIANESFWNPTFDQCVEIAKVMTPDILVKFSHSEYYGIIDSVDIGSRHYPGWEGLIKYANYFRPIIFDEALHVNTYNVSETLTDPGLRDVWGDYLKFFVDNMYESPAILGLAIWSGVDEMYYPKGRKLIGYGPWGVLDVFRREKPEYWHMKMAYSPIQLVSKYFQATTDQVIVNIISRYSILEGKDLEIMWMDGNSKGRLICSDISQGINTLIIPHKMTTDSLKLFFYDKQNFEIFSCILTDRSQNEKVMPCLAEGKAPQIMSTGTDINVFAENVKYTFSTSSGLLSNVILDDKTIMSGLKLHLIPMGGSTEVVDFIPQDKEESKEKYFLSDYLENWKLDTLFYSSNASYAAIHAVGRYDSIPVHYTFVINDRGQLRVNYKINMKKINVGHVRQIGIGFNLPNDYNELTWEREGLWTIYPNDHIGRNKGIAYLFSNNELDEITQSREYPDWTFAEENSIYGTSDFRATKHNIYTAAFLNRYTNDCVKIESNGMQHLRSWYKDGFIHFTVLNYSNAGDEYYFSYDSNRTRISPTEKLLDGGDFCGWVQLNFNAQVETHKN